MFVVQDKDNLVYVDTAKQNGNMMVNVFMEKVMFQDADEQERTIQFKFANNNLC